MLSGKEFLKLADQIIAKYPEAFSALEEYDRTRRLPKLKYKKRVNFTLDSELFRKFRVYCEEKGIKMSTFIERIIMKELKNE